MVPLCRTHHRAAHRAGDERAWWKAAGIDPLTAARKLWKHTRMAEGRINTGRTGQSADPNRKSETPAVEGTTPT